MTLKDVARPGLKWLGRKLPAFLFKHIYAGGDLERDIHLLFEAPDPATVFLPGDLQAPSLEFCVEVLNASPYLDVRVGATHCFLTAHSNQVVGNVFAQFSRWDKRVLLRGGTMLIRIDFWLNEFQLAIVQKYIRGEAWVTASVTVWVESKIGHIHSSRSFRLGKPHIG